MHDTQTSIYEFARQGLQENASRIALRFYGGKMNYQELFRRIDCAADHLGYLGIGLGTVVTIHLPNCPQAVVAVYAVAKLGGICNMVHPLMPLDGLRENMREAKSEVLITGSQAFRRESIAFVQTLIYADLSAHMGRAARFSYRLKCRGKKAKNVYAFEEMERPAAAAAPIPEQHTLAGRCVCYMHSSGTTGKPKVVMQSHGSFNRYVCNTQEFLHGYDMSKSATPTVLPMFHAVGLVMIFHQFIANKGQLLILARYSPKEVIRLIRRYRADMLGGVPSMYWSLLKEPGFNARNMASLRQCYVFGDRVHPQLKDQVDMRLSPTGKRHILFESYSMSELAPGGTSDGPYVPYRRESAGKPMPNTKVALLRDGTFSTGPGEGELLLRGNTMMLGYLLPEDERDAYWIENGEKWIKSGDYGRIDEDGYVYFIDRIKNVIVHHGYNVYPSEVEAVLRQIDDIQDICVVGATEPDSGTQCVRVCAVLRKGADQAVVRQRIKAVAAQKLPGYALPKQIIFWDSLPKNEMGKTDRSELEE